MIVQCRGCKRHYWRYRADHPPRFFCSLECSRRSQHHSREEPPPPTPQAVLKEMYRHRREAHDSTSILAWYECERCDQLDGQYSASLAYHTEHAAT